MGGLQEQGWETHQAEDGGEQPFRGVRVAFVTGEFPPMRGGMGDYTRELGIALTHLGYQVHVVTHVQARAATQDPRVAAHLRVHPIIPRWNWQGLRRVLAHLRQLRPHIVHIQYQTAAYGMHPAINTLPWLARSFLPHARVALTYHDLLVPYLFPKAGPLRRWITYFPARHAHLVIVTNAEDEQTLRRVGLTPARIPIGPNVHPLPVSAEEVSAFRRARGIPAGARVVGYFGFLNRSKGADILVRALDLLAREGRDVHLLMLGEQVGASDPTNRAYREEVEELVARLGMQARVHWTGYLDEARLSAGFAACDVVALPYRDGASLRRGTLQAALVHAAAIVTTTPRVPQGANFDTAMYFVPPEDPRALAAGIAYLLDHPDVREALRQRARVLSQHFTWEKIAMKHTQAYQRALEPT